MGFIWNVHHSILKINITGTLSYKKKLVKMYPNDELHIFLYYIFKSYVCNVIEYLNEYSIDVSAKYYLWVGNFDNPT
jgi:hypothetical protein